jgi:hypothetical protein
MGVSQPEWRVGRETYMSDQAEMAFIAECDTSLMARHLANGIDLLMRRMDKTWMVVIVADSRELIVFESASKRSAYSDFIQWR